MKKVIIASLVIALTSCQKEDMNVTSEKTTPGENIDNVLTADESRFLENLRALRVTRITERDEVNYYNPDNPYESMGIYLHGMIEAVKQQEDAQPSPDYTSFRARFTNYQAAHPFSLSENPDVSGLLPEAIMGLIKAESLQSADKDLAVVNIKLIEDAVLETDLLSATSKCGLLGFAAVTRYMLQDMDALASMMDQVVPLPTGVSTWGDCWEVHYAQRLNDSLNGWEESPASTFVSWLGLPGTIVTSMIDAAWDCR